MTISKRATRDYHPATIERATTPSKKAQKLRTSSLKIPKDTNNYEVEVEGKLVKLTNLHKLFWPDLGITKRELIQYYVEVAPALLPHLKDRAMVMKRYPNGAAGDFFFMKRSPKPRTDWIDICNIEHSSGNIIDFPMIQDLASLMWVINLGCIDLNQWYARCDDVDRPDYLHFDLDPVPGSSFAQVLETTLTLKATLDSLKMPAFAKTTGSKGIHVYVPIVRGPTQKEVWTFAKQVAQLLAAENPNLITAEYRISKRPRGRILVDYNQNAWGRTLASIYSVRPQPKATVSAPVTWKEIEKGISIDDFRIENMGRRIKRLGDLWKPLLEKKGRFRLEQYLK